jgi:cation:H+ antiporter
MVPVPQRCCGTGLTMQFLLMLGGVALLYAGAEALVRGGVTLAARLGMTPLVIGLTVVAFGTSMPEMVVSVGAAAAGSGPIAVGNVVGSNICNIALILGISALIRPMRVQAQVIRFDTPILVGVSLLLVVLLGDDRLGRSEGLLLVSALAAYVIVSVRAARREAAAVQEEFAGGTPRPGYSLGFGVGAVLLGLVMLVLGARWFVAGAVALARAAGVSEAVVGLTIVAVGTSLPELATSTVAAARGEGDISVGNVIGSNIFNLLGILGTAALVRPIGPTGMRGADLGVMLGLSVLLLPVVWSGLRVNRAEGALLLGLYAGYAAYLVR